MISESSGISSTSTTKLTIIHFNDVYNVEPSKTEPKGGAARFVTAVQSFRELNPLILFSGDAFNPSMISTITKGTHLVPILNALPVTCAVYGNHDFDFGIENLLENASNCKFPWLLSNCFDVESGNILANGKQFEIVENNDLKIGLIGLIEQEWVVTLSTVDPGAVEVTDFCEEGRSLAVDLKQNKGCDLVIALTHMRWPNDILLAESVPEIDIILGGHDHNYGIHVVDGRYVLKSGTDFREFSKLELSFDKANKKLTNVTIDKVIVDSRWSEDEEIKVVVDKYWSQLESQMDKVLGKLDVDLEGRFTKVRNEETNLGNLITDIMLTSVEADVALLNSGTLRSDAIIPAGKFTMRDLCTMLPLLDPLVVLETTGEQLLQALENGVSQYPKLEGRFLQVSGIRFIFDPNKPAGQRVDASSVFIGEEQLDLEQSYRVCTKSYMALGKDGFDVLAKCKVLVDDELGPLLSIAVQNYFTAVQVLNGFTKPKTKHRPRALNMTRRKTLCVDTLESQVRRSRNTLTVDTGKYSRAAIRRISHHDYPVNQTIIKIPSKDRWKVVKDSVGLCNEEERKLCNVAPKVEGRIKMVNTQSI